MADAATGPGARHLGEARRLMQACGANAQDAASIADALEKVCRHATDHLEPLISRRAAQALLTRAVYLAKPGSPILSAVSTAEANADPASDLPPCLRGARADEALQAATGVLGHFVWLLTRFISDDLGMRLLREACPDRDEEQQ